MNDWDKQELYLQGAETYYYLNQVHHTSMNSISAFCKVFPSSLIMHVAHFFFFLCAPLGWRLWIEREAGQAGLPALGSVLWDYRSACRPDLHRLGHPLLYPAARQHVLQLIRGVCVCVGEIVRIKQIRHRYHTSVDVFASERLVWGGSYLQRGWSQEGRLLITDFLRGPADRHHSQSHSQ